VILSFLVLILSIQSKLGLKTNIVYDRVLELWNGPSDDEYRKKNLKRKIRNDVVNHNQHVSSQADVLDIPTPKQPPPNPEPSTARGTVKPQDNEHGGLIGESKSTHESSSFFRQSSMMR
jgi:hypothetical protein